MRKTILVFLPFLGWKMGLLIKIYPAVVFPFPKICYLEEIEQGKFGGWKKVDIKKLTTPKKIHYMT